MNGSSKPKYIEKYNRQKLIGTGAFGQAWLVQAKADGKQLVMKEIKIAKVKKSEKSSFNRGTNDARFTFQMTNKERDDARKEVRSR